MIEKIQHATASSPEGARGLVKGVLACAFQNMALPFLLFRKYREKNLLLLYDA